MYRFIFSIATFYNSFLRTNFTKKSPASELTGLNITNLFAYWWLTRRCAAMVSYLVPGCP